MGAILAGGTKLFRKGESKRLSWKLGALSVALGLTVLLELLGVVDAGDALLRTWYYAARGESDAPASVVFVALDERTVDVWGPPPWDWKELDPTLAAVMDGKPRAVAFLEPGPWLDARQRPQWVNQAANDGQILLAERSSAYQPRLVFGRMGLVDSIELGSDDSLNGPSVFARLLHKLGYEREGALRVLFRGGRESLATVPAHRVAAKEVPSSVFHDRVVVVGFSGRHLAADVPTPVGMMAPSEVHVHGLISVLAGQQWQELRFFERWTVWAAVGLLSLLFFAGALIRRALWMSLVMIAFVVAVDAYLFLHGILLVGATGALFVGAFSSTFIWLSERKEVHNRLADFQRWSADAALVGAHGIVGDGVDWDRFIESASELVSAQSMMLFELPDDAWRLEARAAKRTGPEEIHEMRRDVRRDPYRAPYTTHHMMWSERRFMKDDDVKTLLVPLSGFNRLLGIWALNFDKEHQLSDSERKSIQLVADQIALTVEKERLRKIAKEAFDKESLAFGEGYLVQEINRVRDLTTSAMNRNRELSSVMDGLPFGIMIADLWGGVGFKNRFMMRWLQHHQIDAMSSNFNPFLERITGLSTVNLQAMVSDTIMNESVARIRLSLGEETSKHAFLTVVRGLGGRSNLDRADRQQLALVLIVSEFELDERMLTDWTWRLRNSRASHTG